MEMVQPDGPGGAPVSYHYGLFQWQHPVADAPALQRATIQRIPIDPTLPFASFVVDSATSPANPFSLMPTAMVPGAIYSLQAAGLQASDWPGEFSVRWSGAAPGDFIVVSVPYPAGATTVRFNGLLDAVPAASFAALQAATTNDHFLDAGTNTLHLKLLITGFGTSVWTGDMVHATVTR
jgi:hypothetical protein